MKAALDKIFDALSDDAQKNLQENKTGTLLDSATPKELQAGGRIPFDFSLNARGNYTFETEKYGAGVTVSADAVVTGPDATYSITVKSSDGGGGHWDGVHINQELKMQIKTSFWHKTKITVDLHASIQNQPGKGVISYTY